MLEGGYSRILLLYLLCTVLFATRRIESSEERSEEWTSYRRVATCPALEWADCLCCSPMRLVKDCDRDPCRSSVRGA